MAARNKSGNDRSGTETRVAFIAPLNFVAFYKTLVSAIVTGMHLFIVPYVTVKNSVQLRRYFEEEGITVLFLSPSLIRALKGNIPPCVNPYIFNHTTIEVDNPFRVRTLGTMRQFKGIEGIDCEVVPVVNKGAACGLMNIQILTKKDGGQELRLTYSDEKYKKDTAEKVLALFCKNTEKIIADMTENRG